ncbi:MAG: two-component regulator propeller domain-containing protein [Bacteroidota bacterium]
MTTPLLRKMKFLVNDISQAAVSALATPKTTLFLLFSTLTLLTSCRGQTSGKGNGSDGRDAMVLSGDTVAALGSSIMVIYQDKNGVYWFGSWESGVYRYDGKALVHFTTKHGLPQNRIDEIKEDSAGNIYFSSCSPESSVCRFDGSRFRTLSPVTSVSWKIQPTDSWFRDAYSSEKVYRYDGVTLHELQLPKPPGIPNAFEIYSIYTDRMGNVWFGTNPSGVCRYNGTSFDWITEEDVTEFRNEGANGVRSMLEDAHGDFWFNTEYRYSVYDSATLKSNSFYTRHESIGGLDGKKDSVLDEFLSAVCDNDDNLWFVTYRDGVWKYDDGKITQYVVQHDSKPITLFSIYKDNQGILWLGTHENGAFKFNGTAFEKFTMQ